MSAPSDRVRVKESAPVASDFAASQGTPIVVNAAARTGGAYYYDNAGNIVKIGNTFYINVRDYGAVGDGVTDDTTAIGAAFAAGIALGYRRIYFPAGTYLISTAISISGDWMMLGDGPSISVILVSHAGNAVTFTGVTTIRDNDKLEIVHLGFKTTNASANIAIKGTWSVSGSGAIAAQPCCLIYDVEIGAGSSSAAFLYGIYLEGANHGAIENVAVYCYASGSYRANSVAIYLDGLAGTPNLTDFKVRGCTLHYCEYGLRCIDTEGIHFQQNTVLSCRYGFVADTTLTIGKPYMDVTGNHFAVGQYGVYLRETVQAIVADNLIYGLTSISSSTSFSGVVIDSGSIGAGVTHDSIVRDNIVVVFEDSGTFSTFKRGVQVTGTSGVSESILIKGNKTVNCGRLVYLNADCVNVVVLDDNASPTGETWEDVSGLNSLPYGTYTPTGYGITNCVDADITPQEARWTRSGNIVEVFGSVLVDPTAAAATTTFRLTLPVPTNMSASTVLAGTINPKGINAPGGTAEMHTATSPDRVEFNFWATIATSITLAYSYSYRVS